jgi:hypothetical protein
VGASLRPHQCARKASAVPKLIARLLNTATEYLGIQSQYIFDF